MQLKVCVDFYYCSVCWIVSFFSPDLCFTFCYPTVKLGLYPEFPCLHFPVGCEHRKTPASDQKLRVGQHWVFIPGPTQTCKIKAAFLYYRGLSSCWVAIAYTESICTSFSWELCQKLAGENITKIIC